MGFKKMFHALEEHIAMNRYLVRFHAIDIVALAGINGGVLGSVRL